MVFVCLWWSYNIILLPTNAAAALDIGCGGLRLRDAEGFHVELGESWEKNV